MAEVIDYHTSVCKLESTSRQSLVGVWEIQMSFVVHCDVLRRFPTSHKQFLLMRFYQSVGAAMSTACSVPNASVINAHVDD